MSIRMRHTSAHTKNRRSHHALSKRVIVTDKESKAPRLPHRLDETTGMYRGKLIAPIKVKAVKSKAKTKHDHAYDHAAHAHSHEALALPEPKTKEAKPKGFLGKVKQQNTKSRSATAGN